MKRFSEIARDCSSLARRALDRPPEWRRDSWELTLLLKTGSVKTGPRPPQVQEEEEETMNAQAKG